MLIINSSPKYWALTMAQHYPWHWAYNWEHTGHDPQLHGTNSLRGNTERGQRALEGSAGVQWVVKGKPRRAEGAPKKEKGLAEQLGEIKDEHSRNRENCGRKFRRRCILKRVKKNQTGWSQSIPRTCEVMTNLRSRALRHCPSLHNSLHAQISPTTHRPTSLHTLLLALYSHNGKWDTCPQEAVTNDTISSFRDQPRALSFRCTASFISHLSFTHIKTHHTWIL